MYLTGKKLKVKNTKMQNSAAKTRLKRKKRSKI